MKKETKKAIPGFLSPIWLLLTKVILPIIERLGDIDFVIEKSKEPGWIEKMMNFILEMPDPFINLAVFIAGLLWILYAFDKIPFLKKQIKTEGEFIYSDNKHKMLVKKIPDSIKNILEPSNKQKIIVHKKLPIVRFRIIGEYVNGKKIDLPNVGFNFLTMENYTVEMYVKIHIFNNGEELGQPIKDKEGYFCGNKSLKMNLYGQEYQKIFNLPPNAIDNEGQLKIAVEITIIDKFNEMNKLLPDYWIYNRKNSSWEKQT